MNTCIYTVVAPNYKCFIPLFKYCANGAYPECSVYVKEVDSEGLTAASMRFLECDETLEKFDNVLITDVDIMLKREEPTFVYQHLHHMNRFGLQCYSNWFNGDRMSGVHFVTKDWWDRTEEVRDMWLDRFEKHIPITKDDDEKMLYDIIMRSGIPINSEPILWNHHGLHLGKFRHGKNTAQAGEDVIYYNLTHDDKFMALVAENKRELLDRIFINMKASF